MPRAVLAVLAAFAGAFVSAFTVPRAQAAAPDSELDALRSTVSTEGFELAIDPRPFQFPRDHGPHPQFRHEWWYVTGNLDASSGERFGFELTFFRVALAPPSVDVVEKDASHWRARQVYTAHFAVTDVARGRFWFAQKFSRDALGLAGAQAEPFHVWLDDWALGAASAGKDARARDEPGPSAAARLDGDARGADWKLHAGGGDYELTLDAQPLVQPVLNGEQGLSRKAAERGAASYYYSIPRVAVRGRIVRAGRSLQVAGLAWLDREWGSGSLGSAEQGWDWFALQLGDGSALMFYVMRNKDGSRDAHSAGMWRDETGRVQPLSSDQVRIDVMDHWVSPRGGKYPSRWRVQVPAAGLDVAVRPVMADQELGTRPRYWEGAVDVSGTRGARTASGRGYVELVGYGE